jgi:NADPH:quinone reductase
MSMRAFLPSGDRALAALSDIDVPTPRADEALVAVEAFSVNRGEIMLLASGRQDPPGKDIAGRVVRAAADGSGTAAGTPSSYTSSTAAGPSRPARPRAASPPFPPRSPPKPPPRCRWPG